jgi:hypothetical protein
MSRSRDEKSVIVGQQQSEVRVVDLTVRSRKDFFKAKREIKQILLKVLPSGF